MFTCPKLNKALTPPSNSMEEVEDFNQLANQFMNFPGSPYGCLWMSLTDAVEEGVWRDHYTGLEASKDVLETEVGGLKESSDYNCGIVS